MWLGALIGFVVGFVLFAQHGGLALFRTHSDPLALTYALTYAGTQCVLTAIVGAIIGWFATRKKKTPPAP